MLPRSCTTTTCGYSGERLTARSTKGPCGCLAVEKFFACGAKRVFAETRLRDSSFPLAGGLTSRFSAVESTHWQLAKLVVVLFLVFGRPIPDRRSSSAAGAAGSGAERAQRGAGSGEREALC
jgi:hypothetical protein